MGRKRSAKTGKGITNLGGCARKQLHVYNAQELRAQGDAPSDRAISTQNRRNKGTHRKNKENKSEQHARAQ